MSNPLLSQKNKLQLGLHERCIGLSTYLRQLHRETEGISAIETIALGAIVAFLFVTIINFLQAHGYDMIARQMDDSLNCQIGLWRSGANTHCGQPGFEPHRTEPHIPNNSNLDGPLTCVTTGDWRNRTELSDIDFTLEPSGWRASNPGNGDSGVVVLEFRTKIHANLNGTLMCRETCSDGTERIRETPINYSVISPEFILQKGYLMTGLKFKQNIILQIILLLRPTTVLVAKFIKNADLINLIINGYEPAIAMLNRSADHICGGNFDQSQLQQIINTSGEKMIELIKRKFSGEPEWCPSGHLCA